MKFSKKTNDWMQTSVQKVLAEHLVDDKAEETSATIFTGSTELWFVMVAS